MILQKDLIAESGLSRTMADTTLKALRKAGKVTAQKDRLNNNRISYSTEDAAKIRAEFATVKAQIAKTKTERVPPKKTVPKGNEKHTPKTKGDDSNADTSVQDFVAHRGPDKTEVKTQTKKEKETAAATTKKDAKPVPFYKNPIVYGGAALLLVIGLIWIYKQRQKKQQQPEANQQASYSPEPRKTTAPNLADQYKVI